MNYELIKIHVSSRLNNNDSCWNLDKEGKFSVDGIEFELMPWRYDRRLRALRGLSVENNVLRKICSYKSQRIGKKSENMKNVLMTELDICQCLTDDKINSVYAIGVGNETLSAILKTSKGILCNIEISLTLSEETSPVVRHELVGKEGMISDRSINEQVPVEAVYVFENDKKHPTTYTDMDPDMLGLNPAEIMVADNIIDILSSKCNPQEINAIKKEAEDLAEFVMMARDKGRVFKREENQK